MRRVSSLKFKITNFGVEHYAAVASRRVCGAARGAVCEDMCGWCRCRPPRAPRLRPAAACSGPTRTGGTTRARSPSPSPPRVAGRQLQEYHQFRKFLKRQFPEMHRRKRTDQHTAPARCRSRNGAREWRRWRRRAGEHGGKIPYRRLMTLTTISGCSRGGSRSAASPGTWGRCRCQGRRPSRHRARAAWGSGRSGGPPSCAGHHGRTHHTGVMGRVGK